MEALAYQKSHDHCKGTTKKHAEHLYLATYFLPPKKRESVRALYSFYHFINQGAEQTSTVLEKQSHLKKCNELVDRVFESRRRDFVYPFENVLEQAIFRYSIPKKVIQDMLAGMVLKSHFRQPRSEDELVSYSDHAMGALLHMMTYVFGSTIEVERQATDLGAAMEILDLARHVRDMVQHGKVFYPLEWLNDAELTEEDVLKLGQKKKAAPRDILQKLWKVQSRLLELGLRLNKGAAGLIPYLSADGSRMCAALLCAHTEFMLTKLSKTGPNGFYQKPELGIWDQVRIFGLSRQF